LKSGSPVLLMAEWSLLLAQLHPDWRVRSGPRLVRCVESADYSALLALCASIGELSNAQDHHPDMLLRWGRLEIAFWTHSVGGLSLNDFVMAAKIDPIAARARC
jgi:4a-hydroxytetrahydrobiopterin dehydratase